MQSLRLGIDTGGTYTDAVLIDGADQVEASAKVLTNHQDLVSSIRHVLDTLPQAVSYTHLTLPTIYSV